MGEHAPHVVAASANPTTITTTTAAAIAARKPTAALGANPSAGEGPLTRSLLVAVLACTIGSSFQFGYHIGNVNAPAKFIISWFQESYQQMHGQPLSSEAAEFQFSIAVGIFAVGGCVGGLASGWFADRFGRKKAMLMNNALLLIAAAFLTLAKASGIFYLFTIGRAIIGVNAGLNTGLAPMYLSEVSPTNLRGSIGSLHQLFVTISILISQLLGLPFLFGTARLWPLMFGATIVPALVQLVVLPFCAESPKYTLVKLGRPDQAEADLKQLRDRADVSEELDTYKEEAEAARGQATTTIGDMFSVDYRWPMIVAIVMMFSNQLTGINATMFYSTKIFEGAGLKGDAPIYATIVMGAVNVLMTLVSVYLVDHPRFGRRVLHLGGLSGMLVSVLLLTLSLSFVGDRNSHGAPSELASVASYGAIIFVLLFVISYATGPGSIPWFFINELFDAKARGSASSIAVTSNWACVVAVSLAFLPLNNLLGRYCFLVFAGFLIVLLLFLAKVMPETKGKSVEQINAEMKKR